ncbi:hypothetical protein LXL04_038787 [Taraxacum kok-saghyz]
MNLYNTYLKGFFKKNLKKKTQKKKLHICKKLKKKRLHICKNFIWNCPNYNTLHALSIHNLYHAKLLVAFHGSMNYGKIQKHEEMLMLRSCLLYTEVALTVNMRTTFFKSASIRGLPLLQITEVPMKLNSSFAISISISSLSLSASTTTTPPPMLLFAIAKSTFSEIASETSPNIMANINIPPELIDTETILDPVPTLSAWFPESATNVHESQRASARLPSLTA